MAALNGAGTPASSVFVGNLAYDLSEQDVIDYFSKVGPVKTVRIVTERETGKPRGFGFIEFFDIPTADSAIRNLSGTELNGRVIRIVFAEGGPPGGGDFRPRQTDDRGDDRARRAAARNKLVGADLAYHSSQGMGVLLGQQAQPNAPADQLTTILARKTRSDLYEYLFQMQTLLQQNPQQARQVLADNPQLVRALFQMEVILGMVSNPLGDIAPKGIAPSGILPPRPGEYSHQQQQQQQPAQYMPAPAAAPMAAPIDPRLGGSAPPPMDPRLQGMAAPMVAAPAPMAAAPRPMVSAASAPPAGGMPGAVPGMSAEQQQVLLQQVMGLTPEQIELLPPQQKAQVLALQQQLRAQ